MGTFLFKVDDRFFIADRGLVLTPGLGDKVQLVTVGTEIKLIRPDKSELRTTIKGIVFEGQHDIFISQIFSKDDIPIGTEIWTTK